MRTVDINKMDDFPLPERLSDKQLLKSLCEAAPKCFECDVDQCNFGREYRRRVRSGEWGKRTHRVLKEKTNDSK